MPNGRKISAKNVAQEVLDALHRSAMRSNKEILKAIIEHPESLYTLAKIADETDDIEMPKAEGT